MVSRGARYYFGDSRRDPALVRVIAVAYHVVVMTHVIAWLALIAQTVSACGAGLALCINSEGTVRLEVAGVPCDSCSRHACEHDQDDEDDCCSEELCRLPESANAWTHACGCLHVDLADPAMVPLAASTDDVAQAVTASDAPPAIHDLIGLDVPASRRYHDPPSPRYHFTSHLAMIHSVMLRC